VGTDGSIAIGQIMFLLILLILSIKKIFNQWIDNIDEKLNQLVDQ
jgi:hypothetical protein